MIKHPLTHFFPVTARRRAAAKRKKLKNLGKSKSTDTEEEEVDEDCGDDGKNKKISLKTIKTEQKNQLGIRYTKKT